MAENEREQIERITEDNRKKLIIISISVASCIAAIIVAVLLLLPLFNNNEALNNDGDNVLADSEADFSVSDLPNDDLSKEPDNQHAVTDESLPPEPFTGWIINKRGYTFVFENRGLQQFNGTATTAKRYADAVNAVAGMFDKANVYSIIAPTAVEYVYSEIPEEYKQDFYCRSQSRFVMSAERAYSDSIHAVDVIQSIAEHKDEYIYFYTDTNWTSKGAYYAYKTFAELSGNEAVDLAACQEGVNKPFLGQFYSCTQAGTDQASIAAADALYYNADSVYYYKIPDYENIEIRGGYELTGNPISAWRFGYYTFIGDDAECLDIFTGNSGKKLLVIGDSSVPPMLQFLAANYSEIYYVNTMLYTDDLSQYADVDDVLIMNYATAAATPELCENLTALTENE